MEEEGFSEILLDLFISELTLALSSTAAAPFERVKLLLQNQEELVKSGRLLKPYKGVKDCFRQTVKKEGFLALWRGNSANVHRILPIRFHSFIFRRYFKKLLNVNNDEDGYLKRLFGKMLSFCLEDASGLLLVYSLDYARTRLATDVKAGNKGGERHFKGLIDVYRKTLKSDGLSGLYSGFGISCFRIVVYRALFFGIYDFLKPMVQVSSISTFLLGWGMKIVAVLGTYPIDTVRRRMMMTSGEAFKYSSSTAAFKQMVANEGFKSLFKGASANVLVVLVQVGFLRRYGVKLALIFSDLWWLLILPSHVLKKFRLM